MKTLKGGVLKKTFEQALEKIKEIGTDQDVEFFKTMFENSNQNVVYQKDIKESVCTNMIIFLVNYSETK